MSGNKPPWTLPAKAKYLKFDGDRAKKYFGAQDMSTPEFSPILSILVSVLYHLVCSAFLRDSASYAASE